MKIDTAVLPIAGLGTRFLPLSKVIPKEFFPLGEKPVLQYIIEEAVEAGIEKFIFVISPEKKEIFEKYILKYFREDNKLLSILKKRKKRKAVKSLNAIPKIKYSYVVQDNPRGDGDAVLRAEKFVKNKPFLVLFGDDVSFNKKGSQMASQMIESFEKTGKTLLCLYKKPKEELSAYGVPQISKINSKLVKISDIAEKPKKDIPSDFAVVGKYVLTPEIFSYLKKTKAVNGDVFLANSIKKMIEDGKEVFGLAVEGKWLECGTKEKWLKSFIYLSKNKST